MPGASNTTQLDLSDFEEPENPLTALQILNAAVSLFKNIPKFNCVNWTESFNTLLHLLVKESKLEAAHRIFLENSWVGSEVSHSWPEPAIGCSLSATLLDALCDIGQVEDALEILGKIIMKGVKAPKRCRDRLDLSQCNNGEDMKPTKRLINEALIRGGVPRLGSYSAMAVDLYRKGKSTGQTCKVLDKTQERGYKDHHLGLMKRRSPHCEEKVVGVTRDKKN
ncbi:hypothetical protein NC652_033101 [Populus alba x Populus x berolinensis]|nr:hypothetical protein NC652_033101 [Populus alba x Populus x berolinensis]